MPLIGPPALQRQSDTRRDAVPRQPKRCAALADLRALPAAVLGFLLPFFGFGGCIAVACSGTELAAALLLLAFWSSGPFRAAARSACASDSHASLLCRSMRWARLVSACRCRFAARSACASPYFLYITGLRV